MANREGAAAPNWRQGQNQYKINNKIKMQAGQWNIHINWSHFKPEISGKSEEECRGHIFYAPMIGCMITTLMKI